ncbi:MAG: Holliday junction resolvase RuvX [Bacteroidales bacterium]|nr:Holliday junction resolvase RuvX [Bacteroidales bacterium]
MCIFVFMQDNFGRIVAIDYGQKRVGIAVTDCNRLIASGLCTIAASDVFLFLKDYISKEKVSLFIVGKPKQMNNTDSDASRYIEPFVKRLHKEFPQIPIDREDERFTSKMAFQTLIDSGLGKKKRQNKALVDEVAATIMLQNYLQKIEFENQRNKKEE